MRLAAIRSGILEGFERNSGTWLLFGATLVIGYLDYSAQHKLSEVCDLAQAATEIVTPQPLDENGKPIPELDIKAQIAYLKRQRTEHSVDGELYRWQQYEGEQIKAICPSGSEDSQ